MMMMMMMTTTTMMMMMMTMMMMDTQDREDKYTYRTLLERGERKKLFRVPVQG
jgi:hypothetical protein